MLESYISIFAYVIDYHVVYEPSSRCFSVFSVAHNKTLFSLTLLVT